MLAGNIAVGALDAWFYRQWDVNPDGMAYIDLARAFVAHGAGALVNGYWSPLFPAVLGGAIAVGHPTADTLYPLVRAVDFGIFAMAVVAFDGFLRAVLRDPLPARWARPTLLLTAWALFFLIATQATGMHLVTPDFGVAGIVFAIATELVALEREAWRPSRWMRLGAILGVGYWWKAILFPVSLVALACAAWIALRRGDRRGGPVAATATFVLLAAMLAVPVSRLVGRPTFGETGRLNQVWYVNHGTSSLSLCLGPDARIPLERAGEITLDERLLARPLTCRMRYEWPEATMPLWYDPSSWYRKATAVLRPIETFRVVGLDLRYLGGAFADFAPIAGIGLLVMVAVLVGTRTSPGARWPLVTFAALPVVFYVIVYVELRHVMPFLLVLALAGLVALATRGGRMATVTIAIVAAAAGVDAVHRLATQQRVEAAITVHEWQRRPRPEQRSVLVARALLARGLVPGDRVATVNTLWNVEWAHRIGLRVRAYVPELTYPLPHALEELGDPCTLAQFDAAMRTSRVKGVVLRDVPGYASPPGWEPLDTTGYRLRLVPSTESLPAGCAPR